MGLMNSEGEVIAELIDDLLNFHMIMDIDGVPDLCLEPEKGELSRY